MPTAFGAVDRHLKVWGFFQHILITMKNLFRWKIWDMIGEENSFSTTF